MYIFRTNPFNNNKRYNKDDYINKSEHYKKNNAEESSCLDKLLHHKERLLWLYVIIQAADDAASSETDKLSCRARDLAISWFSPEDKNFLLVCEMAGVEPIYVLRSVNRYLRYTTKKSRKQKFRKQIRLRKKNHQQKKPVSLYYKATNLYSNIKSK